MIQSLPFSRFPLKVPYYAKEKDKDMENDNLFQSVKWIFYIMKNSLYSCY